MSVPSIRIFQPDRKGKCFEDEQSQAVGLLAGGAGRAPEAKAAQIAAAFDELGQQLRAQQLEGTAITKEAGFVDGHSIGNGAFEERVLSDLQVLDKLLQVGHALIAQQLCEAGLEEVIARRIEHVLREAENKLAKVAVIDAGGGLHD